MGNCISKSHGETDCDINVSCYNDPSDVYVTIDDNAVNDFQDNIHVTEPVNTDESSIPVYDQLFSNNHILVAAIDFGTSYSGYAFSFRHDYQRDQLKISTNLWAHNSGLSPKAPSAVLIGPDREVKAFGYEAHSKYNELIESGYEINHLYFEKFKMILYTVENLNNLTVIQDICGKEMLAIDVFGLVIEYLRNHLLSRLESQDSKSMLHEDMIQWVLTVPAIWGEKAKQFMRYAAAKGGIPNEHLILALEPEVASLYCRHFPLSLTIYGTRSCTDSLENGSKYLVLDIGGGTVDVTAHEIQSDGTLKELYQASGGSWGGTTVDNEFKKLLITIFGSEVIAETTTDYPSEMVDIMLDFEMKKRTFEPGITKHVSLKCPTCLFSTYQKKNNASIEETIVNTPIGDKIKFLRDKLIINSEKFESLFDNTVNKLVMHLRKLLHLEHLMDITTILLVGGFSDSIIIKNSILSNFPNIRIINPEDCSLAVLKGAVLYGHNPKVIKSRICKFSYGIGIHVKFEEGVHPEERKRTISGSDICDDVFDVHLNLGERVEINTPRLEKVYHAQNNPANIAYLDVYASTSESPMFVTDESCNKIGYVILELSGDKETNESTEETETNIEGTETRIFVSFHYIGSELGVVVREAKTDKMLRAKFDFMG